MVRLKDSRLQRSLRVSMSIQEQVFSIPTAGRPDPCSSRRLFSTSPSDLRNPGLRDPPAHRSDLPADDDPAEWLRDEHPVPAPQGPGPAEGNEDRDDGCTGELGHADQTGLDHSPGPVGPSEAWTAKGCSRRLFTMAASASRPPRVLEPRTGPEVEAHHEPGK